MRSTRTSAAWAAVAVAASLLSVTIVGTQGEGTLEKDPQIVDGATATMLHPVDHDLDTLMTTPGKRAAKPKVNPGPDANANLGG